MLMIKSLSAKKIYQIFPDIIPDILLSIPPGILRDIAIKIML